MKSFDRIKGAFFHRAVLLKVLVVIIFTCLTPQLKAKTHFLLEELPSAQFSSQKVPPGLPDGFPPAKRSRPVKVLPESALRQFHPQDTLVLDLFKDIHLNAVVRRVTKNVNGTLTIRGHIPEYPFASVIISTTDGRTLVTVQIPETGQHFQIQSGPGLIQYFQCSVKEE